MVGRGLVLVLALVGGVMTTDRALAQSSDDLFSQVFGNTAAAEPQAVVLPVMSVPWST